MLPRVRGVTDAPDGSTRLRALAAALEPVAGQVYFAPECHAAYEALGFGPSPGEFGGVAGPDGEAYFCSRGSILGQVPGEVVASAFGVFEHGAVAALVASGWRRTDAATICDARDTGAVAHLRRLLGEAPAGAAEARDLLARAAAPLEPYGRPLFAGLLARDRFDDPLADAWRLADMLREFRGDAHVAAFTLAGFDACRIGIVSELWWGLPARSYSRTRMWREDAFQAAEDRLLADGLVARDEGGRVRLTEAGRAEREAVEAATDRACLPVLEALGDDLERLVSLLAPWGRTIREGRGYPASGPHDLADAVAP